MAFIFAVGIGVHDDEILLRGPYFPLIPYLEGANVDQFALEYATPRAGELDAIRNIGGKSLGFGVINPRTVNVESVDDIVARVDEVRASYLMKKSY